MPLQPRPPAREWQGYPGEAGASPFGAGSGHPRSGDRHSRDRGELVPGEPSYRAGPFHRPDVAHTAGRFPQAGARRRARGPRRATRPLDRGTSRRPFASVRRLSAPRGAEPAARDEVLGDAPGVSRADLGPVHVRGLRPPGSWDLQAHRGRLPLGGRAPGGSPAPLPRPACRSYARALEGDRPTPGRRHPRSNRRIGTTPMAPRRGDPLRTDGRPWLSARKNERAERGWSARTHRAV